jgi:asparagine synthase (glutamine-hydrolysing)
VAHRAFASATIDAQSLYDYAFHHMVPSPRTIFSGVRKVEPASYFEFDGREMSGGRYWRPAYNQKALSGKAGASLLRDTLSAAVRRCEPDDFTGAFLSGGLDSSSVAGTLARLRSERATHTFSIGFNEQGYDEIRYARISAQHFNTSPHEYYVKPDDVADAVQRIAGTYDEPFGNSSAVPTMFCARLARATGMTRLLAGDGGDEIFGGNERYAKQKIFDAYLRVPALFRSWLLEPILNSWVGSIPGPLRKAKSYVAQARIAMPLRLQTYNFVLRRRDATLFEPDFVAQIDRSAPIRMLEAVYADAPGSSLVDRMLYLDWKFTLADNDLRKVNEMCRLEGIEVAYPMLDDELLDLSLRVPARLKVRGTELRYFYRQAMHGFLPIEVLTKRKHGFGLPFGEWLRKSRVLQELAFDSLRALGERGFISRVFIDELMTAHREDHAAFYGNFLWVLVMLEQWLQKQTRPMTPANAPIVSPQ